MSESARVGPEKLQPNWDIPSDEDLINVQLETENPKIFERAEKLEPGLGLVDIIHVYNHRDTYVKCAKCGRTNHYKGYIVLLSDNSHAVIGNDCGEDYFPGKWEEHHKRFKYKQQRQYYLLQIAPAISAISELMEALWNWRHPMKGFDARLRTLRDGHPKLYKALDYARHNGESKLTIANRERDSAAEQVRDSRLSASEQGSRGPIYKYRVVWERPLMGGAVFNMRSPWDLIDDAMSVARKAKAKLEAPKLSNLEMAQAFISLADLPRMLELALAGYDAWNQFSAPENLKNIVDWARKTGEFEDTFAVKARALSVRSAYSDEQVIVERAPLPALGREPHEILAKIQSLNAG